MSEDARPECCQDEENMELVEESFTPGGELVKLKCTVCERNHYVAKVDAVHFGLDGQGM